MIRTYHGWIVVTRNPGYRDSFSVEWTNAESGAREAREMPSAAAAVQWWDERVGSPVALTETPIGAYRVHTGEL